MNFIFFLHIIGACTTLIPAETTDNFDEVAEQFAQSQAKINQRELDWWDIYGKHPVITRNPDLKGYKVFVSTGDLVYGKPLRTSEIPGLVFSQRYDNGQTVPITSEFARKVEMRSFYSWSTATKFNIGMDVEANAGIPGVLDVNAKLSTEIDLQSNEEKKMEETESFEMKYTFDVPPKKSVNAELLVTNKNMVIPWEADILIQGWIVYRFKGHHALWSPIIDLANDKFKLTENKDGLIYRANGTFKGLRGVDTHLQVTDPNFISQFMSKFIG